MKKLLNWTNGKKTFIGLAIYFVLGGLKQIGAIDESSFNQVLLFAEALIGIGIAHKIKKVL